AIAGRLILFARNADVNRIWKELADFISQARTVGFFQIEAQVIVAKIVLHRNDLLERTSNRSQVSPLRERYLIDLSRPPWLGLHKKHGSLDHLVSKVELQG